MHLLEYALEPFAFCDNSSRRENGIMVMVHDLIEKELEEKKSLAAMIYLLEKGREIEFEFAGEAYFMSCDRAQKYVSLWKDKEEQSFDRVEELIENARLGSIAFLSAWKDIKVTYVY